MAIPRTQGCVQVVILVRNDPQPTPRAARGDSRHGVDVVMDDAGNLELSHFSPSATLISRMLSPAVVGRQKANERPRQPHTSWAVSTMRRSLANCCSWVRSLPSTVEEKPHWGDRHSCSIGTKREASSMRRLR